MGIKIGSKNKIIKSTIVGGSQLNTIYESEVNKNKQSFWKGFFTKIISNLIARIIIYIIGGAGVATLIKKI